MEPSEGAKRTFPDTGATRKLDGRNANKPQPFFLAFWLPNYLVRNSDWKNWRRTSRPASVFVGEARMQAYQTSLRKTSAIVESSAFILKGLMSTVAFTRLKKNSMAGSFA